MSKFKIALLILLFPFFVNAIEKEALIVAIGNYKYGSTDVDLPGIDKDIQKMKKLLEAKGFCVRILYNEEATLANTISALESYSYLKKEDVFVYYQSSHGTQIADLNGDEEDSRDEAYVLYEAKFEGKYLINADALLTDDHLNNLLANIPAKKLLLADACHSGTSYKGILGLLKENFFANKTLRSKKVSFKGEIQPSFNQSVLGALSQPKNLVVLAAAKDNQQSISTSEGSFFTSALYDAWVAQPNISFSQLERSVRVHIDNNCALERSKGAQDATTFEPVLYTTTNININQSIDSFLEVTIDIEKDKLVEEYLDELTQRYKSEDLTVSMQSYYNEGDLISLDIDTKNRGYLYILTIPTGENYIEVLYPNKFYKEENGDWEGKFRFPNHDDTFQFEAINNTQTAQKTVVYTILSEQEIPLLENSASITQDDIQTILKNFTGQSSVKNALKNIIMQEDDNQFAIKKTLFSVENKYK